MNIVRNKIPGYFTDLILMISDSGESVLIKYNFNECNKHPRYSLNLLYNSKNYNELIIDSDGNAITQVGLQVKRRIPPKWLKWISFIYDPMIDVDLLMDYDSIRTISLSEFKKYALQHVSYVSAVSYDESSLYEITSFIENAKSIESIMTKMYDFENEVKD